jgi:hypothetical protein
MKTDFKTECAHSDKASGTSAHSYLYIDADCELPNKVIKALESTRIVTSITVDWTWLPALCCCCPEQLKRLLLQLLRGTYDPVGLRELECFKPLSSNSQ